MDFLSPDNVDHLVYLLSTVSEDASDVLIAYFVIPIVMKLVGVAGWLLTLLIFYKGVVMGLGKFFNDGRFKVVKVKTYGDHDDLFLGSDAWEKLMSGAEKYKKGSYISTVQVKTLLEDAAKGRALRLGE